MNGGGERFSPLGFSPLLSGEARTMRSVFPPPCEGWTIRSDLSLGRDPPYSIFPLFPWEKYTHFSFFLWERVGVSVLFDPLFSCVDLKKVVNEKGE